MTIQEEVRRFARLLEAVWRVSKLGVRETERRAGMGSGTLTRIFAGKIDLKLRHILTILEALGVPEEEFFRLAYKERKPRGEAVAQEILDLLEPGLPARMDDASASQQREWLISDEELDRRIEKALRDYGVVPGKRKKKTSRMKSKPPAAGGDIDRGGEDRS